MAIGTIRSSLVLILLLLLVIFIEPNPLANFTVRQNNRRLSDEQRPLDTLKCLPDALQLGSHQSPRVGNSAISKLSKILGRQILRLSSLDNVGKHGKVEILSKLGHGLSVGKGLDKDGVDTNLDGLAGSEYGFFVTVDETVGSG